MDDYSNDAQTYDYEAYNALLAQNSSVWSTFPTTSTLMTRGPSADSSFSTSSGDLIRTPISEYDTHESFWSPVIVVSDDYLVSSLHPDSLHETTFSPIGYNLPYTEEYTNDDGNQYNDVTDEFWWNDYDFVTDLEPGQSPYWRLKQGQEPTDQLPATRAHEDTSATTDVHPQKNEGVYVCMEAGCPKNFRRKADLERHLAQMHTPKEQKLKYPCDWKRCQRAKEPFGRRDHQRDHYRQYHHEDIMPRGASFKGNRRWWNSRIVKPDWWRCARCLTRVKVGDCGYVCPRCRISCEPERQYYRTNT